MRLFIFLFISLFSLPSFAENYYWEGSGQQFSNAPAACEHLRATSSVTVTAVTRIAYSSDNTTATCFGQRGSNSNYGLGYIHRRGTGCDLPLVYDEETRSCKEPPPECPIGDPGIFSTGNGSVIESGGRRYIADPGLPSSICYNQCSYDRNPSAQSCYLVPGSTTEGFCNYVATSNGENCSAPDSPLGKTGDPLNAPDTPDVPPSDPDDPGCPEGWSWSGTTCVRDTPPDPGEGDGDGDDGDPGDGGGGGPGDGGGDGDGDGEGDGGGDGDGDGGDGGTTPGDGEGDDETPGNTGKSSSNCNTRPTYSGDPLLGEILVQQWHTLCAGDELTPQIVRTGLQGEGLVDADTLDNVLARDAENMDSQVSSIISGLYTGGPSSNCPVVDSSVSTPWGVIRIPWSVNCPIFNVISAVIFFFSYLAAGWIVFNALARDD